MFYFPYFNTFSRYLHNFIYSYSYNKNVFVFILRDIILRIFIFKSKMVVRKNRKTHNRLPQKKRRQWNVREKLMIVHYFKNNGSVRGIAKRFNIQPK